MAQKGSNRCHTPCIFRRWAYQANRSFSCIYRYFYRKVVKNQKLTEPFIPMNWTKQKVWREIKRSSYQLRQQKSASGLSVYFRSTVPQRPENKRSLPAIPLPKDNREMKLTDELQNRLFSMTHCSAFLESQRITSTSTRFPLDESQKPSHYQILKRSSG